MMKRMISAAACILVALQGFAEERSFTSPDGKIQVVVNDNAGKPTYSVNYDGNPFILPSPLGLNTSLGEYVAEMTLLPETEAPKLIEEQYSVKTIKQSKVDYKATEAVFTFAQEDRPVFDVIFRVSDRDVAFRYKMYTYKDIRSAVIYSEATGFQLSPSATSFLCPQVKPGGGFAGTYPSYETSYTLDEPVGKNGWGEGYTFPCLFKNEDKGWILISETGVSSAYCASRLLGHEGGLYTIGFPQEGENNGNGSAFAGIPLPGYTAWRTITLGSTLAPIMETTVPFDVVEPLYDASKEYVFGAGSWSWIIGMDGSTVYDVQKKYIDFTAEMGYQTVLIDALWDTQIGREKIADLAAYAKSKGVAIFLWYNSNGYWNNAPQSPKGIMDNTIARRREMAWMKSIGIRGIKVDFFGGDKQETIKLYEDIMADANDYGILCVFHGCTLPRGWERMYPNYASSEAVLASENLNFSQGACNSEAFNATIHPFIRNTVGSMDFGGSALNKYYNARNAPFGSKRRTSDVFALATAVMFQSPVQHFALAPNNLTDAPAWAIDFMKKVPTLWDEVKYIDGYPGKYVIMARRHGDTWYVVGINAQEETLKLEVELPMFAQGDVVKLYSDDKDLNGSLKDLKIKKDSKVKIEIPCNGGIVLQK